MIFLVSQKSYKLHEYVFTASLPVCPISSAYDKAQRDAHLDLALRASPRIFRSIRSTLPP